MSAADLKQNWRRDLATALIAALAVFSGERGFVDHKHANGEHTSLAERLVRVESSIDTCREEIRRLRDTLERREERERLHR